MQKNKEENNSQTNLSPTRNPLRLWAGVVAVVLLWLCRFGMKKVIPGFEGFEMAIMGSFIFAVAVLLWWTAFSRAYHAERWGAILVMPGALIGTWFLKHESMGPLWLAGYAVPWLLLAFVAWAVATRNLADKIRRITMVGTIVLACAIWLLFRTSGINGDHVADFSWRWTESSEELLVDKADDKPILASEAQIDLATEPEWPGFRGPHRDNLISGVRVETDWTASPPEEIWRRSVGSGWSSFSVHGDYFYTQEQRGEDEVVSCYKFTTGEPVWKHVDKERFFESNAGAGPRGTPSLNNGRV